MARGSQGAAVPALFHTQRCHQSYQFIIKNLVGVWPDTTESNLPALVTSSLTLMDITQSTEQPLCQPDLCRFYLYTIYVCVCIICHHIYEIYGLLSPICMALGHSTSDVHAGTCRARPRHNSSAVTDKWHRAQQSWRTTSSS